MDKALVNFIFELGMLKRIKHEGVRLIGVDNPETVADHALRAAQIGYILAKLEGYENPQEVASIMIFHDINECRTNDIHRVANRYISVDKEKVVKEQTQMAGNIGEDIYKLWKVREDRESAAGIIAKDADMLELSFTAKSLIEQGFKDAQDWINNCEKNMRTESGKKLIKLMQEVSSNDWWKGLKKIPPKFPEKK